MPTVNARQERRRRRVLLKAHHPDLGGDPEEFIRAVAAFGAGGSRGPTPPAQAGDEVRFVPTPHGLGRLTAWCDKQQRKRRRRRYPRVL
jgi:hypothetical protein